MLITERELKKIIREFIGSETPKRYVSTAGVSASDESLYGYGGASGYEDIYGYDYGYDGDGDDGGELEEGS